MAWTQPGPGRPPGQKDNPKSARGSATRARVEAASQFARLVVEDAEYRKSLLDRAKRGVLPPQVETALFYYAYGKPVERVEVEDTTPIDVRQLSEAQLAERARLLAGALDAAAAKRAAEEAAEAVAGDGRVLSPEPKSVS